MAAGKCSTGAKNMKTGRCMCFLRRTGIVYTHNTQTQTHTHASGGGLSTSKHIKGNVQEVSQGKGCVSSS